MVLFAFLSAVFAKITVGGQSLATNVRLLLAMPHHPQLLAALDGDMAGIPAFFRFQTGKSADPHLWMPATATRIDAQAVGVLWSGALAD
ncbi:MAG: hypothetical protein U9Q35_03050 [Pseudomonadota bacterium]|nr:hypothetical protein [Pseudomonadota bacterium]